MILEWIATGLGILGAIINATKRIEGFYIWIIANTLWIYIGFKTKLYGMAILFFVYLLIVIYGIITWKKKERK